MNWWWVIYVLPMLIGLPWLRREDRTLYAVLVLQTIFLSWALGLTYVLIVLSPFVPWWLPVWVWMRRTLALQSRDQG